MIGDYAASQRTAIVVDDDDLVLSATSALLEDLGFEAIPQASPQQALSCIREGEKFDLLLTDLMMPGMTGDQLVSKVLEDRPDLPVIVASGYDVGFNDLGGRVVFLRKPYGKQELIRAIGESMLQARGNNS